VAIVALVAVPTTMDAWWNEASTRQADWLTYALVVVSLAALAVRKRWPVPVALTCASALSAWYVLGHHGEALNLPTIVALYTVADLGNRRRSLVAGAIAVGWAMVVGVLVDDPTGFLPGEVAWPLVALLLGENVRGRRELLAEHVARAERDARRRVEEERLRIAREFHDVIAHTMAAVNVQSGVAVAAFDSDPEVARRALQQVRSSGREALHELRATVAVLRHGDDGPGSPPSAAPAPRLAELADLVATAEAAGIDIDARVDLGGAELAGVVELAAYRIVQEALTNVVRHAGARTAVVSVRGDGRVLRIEVSDDGTAAPVADRPEPGFGLTGMAERVAALDGTLEHGPRPGGGFRVLARLPIAAPA
jgi:signal transduction histidine kinase